MGHGKFQELLETAEEHWAPLRFDLLGKLDLPRHPLEGPVPWELLSICVDQLQRDPRSALFRARCDAIRETLPVDDEAEAPSDIDEINMVLLAEYGPLYTMLRRVEHNQRMQMWQKTDRTDAAPEPLPLPADPLVRAREAEMLSLDSDVARAYMASLV